MPKAPDAARNRRIFENMYGNYLIIVSENYFSSDIPSYFWHICDQCRNVLSSNSKSLGEDTAANAFRIAKNTIDRFMD